MRYSTSGTQDAAYIQSIDRSNNNFLYPLNISASYLNLNADKFSVGNSTPQAQLDVDNEIFIRASTKPWDNDTGKGLYMRYSNNGGQDGSYIQSIDRSNGNSLFSMNFYSSLFTFNTGNVGIKTTNPNYDLEVNGTVRATTFSAVSPPSWPDFVFRKSYELITLEELEEHIDEKGHLPEIPSEAEVAEDGINLGEMDAKLLQKIEELTLYMIDLNKEVKQLKSKNQELEERVKSLENE